MKKKKTIYKPFDAAPYLDNDAVIAEYLSAAAEDPNPEVFVAALGDVAKARKTLRRMTPKGHRAGCSRRQRRATPDLR
jgi:probable addiction module antidote protein